ncbi:response regulator transcription factor [Cellulophaga sp. 20_2_10]|uniref:response regulator transcription factor n=1 Tax=Cellulophaga sp. 20_2_10 TaxID=2942476 RepID=UPI00201AA7AA|nr:response regulator transcription factor [Cellulophaga sp. 20_2_10]MCL5245296.1 response regulator transcription factor [Cellulophaga sp. 20_2_10]
MQNTTVLLAEDDFDFGSILKQYLEIHDFAVTWAKDGKEALDFFTKEASNNNPFDICVFDVMMPKMDGFTLAEKIINNSPETPFVFLTAKKMKEDKIKGLKLGADDYIVKPFEADILILRLKNILKRTQKNIHQSKSNSSYNIGAYVFNPVNYQLLFNNTTQRLTEKEAQLIAYFFEHKNQMVKRDDLLTAVWGTDDFFSGRSMDVFISRLRKYFKEDNNISIESARGVGLTFKIKE